MKFILDENFPRPVIDLLERYGHTAQSALEFLNKGVDDFGVFGLAQEQNAILVTTDKDFFHDVPLLFKNHAGVIVIALHQPNRRKLLNRFEWALRWLQQGDITGRVLFVTDYHHLISS